MRTEQPTCPRVTAGSTGRRNTGFKSLCRGFKSQGLAWPLIELAGHFVQASLRVFLRVDGEVYATPPLCPHLDEPLADGICEGGNLICTRHFWQWNLRTGEPHGDAEVPLLKYKVKVEPDGSVHVFIDEELYYD